MKKTAVILLVILLVSMLGGCYKSDVVMNVGYDGGVEVTSVISAPAQGYVKNNITKMEELKEVLDYVNKGIEKESEKISLECVDEDGNKLSDDAEWAAEEEKVIKSRLKAKYGNMEVAVKSPVFTFLYPYTSIGKDENGSGIEIVEKRTLFGTKYTASGNFSSFRKEMMQADLETQIKSLEDQLAMYDAMEVSEEEAQYLEIYREQINMQIDELRKTEETFKNTSASVTFNFPFAFSKSNADSKNFLGNKLTWETTGEAEAKEIKFEVFVINPVILAAGFIILILLIIILILALKKKKKPDAFFVDAEGNEIPVFDVEETDGDFEEEAEEVQEVSEEPEEVLSFGDVMAEPEEPIAEEETKETNE